MNVNGAVHGTATDSDESTPRPVTPPHQIIHPGGTSTSSSSSNGDLTVWSLNQIYSSCLSDDGRGWDRTRAFLGNLSAGLQSLVAYFPDADDGEYWSGFPLPQEEFESLKRSDFHADEVLQYDYDATTEAVVFRMPVPHAHYHVQARLAHKIVSKLEEIAELDANAKSFIDRLDASIQTPTEYADSVRRPDFSSRHLSQPYPAVIGEIAFSDTPKNIRNLANEYHYDLRSYINVVFGLRFEFWNDEDGDFKISAKLSTWRPDENDAWNVRILREDFMLYDESGNKIVDEDAGLRLTLEDFAFFRQPHEFPDLIQHEVFVSLEELQEMLGEAAEIHQAYSATGIQSAFGSHVA